VSVASLHRRITQESGGFAPTKQSLSFLFTHASVDPRYRELLDAAADTPDTDLPTLAATYLLDMPYDWDGAEFEADWQALRTLLVLAGYNLKSDFNAKVRHTSKMAEVLSQTQQNATNKLWITVKRTEDGDTCFVRGAHRSGRRQRTATKEEEGAGETSE